VPTTRKLATKKRLFLKIRESKKSNVVRRTLITLILMIVTDKIGVYHNKSVLSAYSFHCYNLNLKQSVLKREMFFIIYLTQEHQHLAQK